MKSIHLSFLLCLILHHQATTARADDSAPDARRLQGTWKAVVEMCDGIVSNGMDYTLTFVGNRIDTKVDGKTYSCWYTIDPSKSPKHFDAEISFGTFVIHVRGIYEIDGDRLKWCVSHQGAAERPNEFVAKKGDNWKYTVFRKVASDRDDMPGASHDQ